METSSPGYPSTCAIHTIPAATVTAPAHRSLGSSALHSDVNQRPLPFGLYPLQQSLYLEAQSNYVLEMQCRVPRGESLRVRNYNAYCDYWGKIADGLNNMKRKSRPSKERKWKEGWREGEKRGNKQCCSLVIQEWQSSETSVEETEKETLQFKTVSAALLLPILKEINDSPTGSQ